MQIQWGDLVQHFYEEKSVSANNQLLNRTSVMNSKQEKDYKLEGADE
jgi:hypothetical protein